MTTQAGRYALPAGIGVGWRPGISGGVANVRGLAGGELIAGTLAPAGPPRGVAELRERAIGPTDPVPLADAVLGMAP